MVDLRPNRSKPHFLFIATKWVNGNPELGMGSCPQILWGPLEASGFGTYDYFLVDEYYFTHRKPCDGALIKFCERIGPDIIILVWWPGAPNHLNPALETLYRMRKNLEIPIVAIWFDTWADWLVEVAEKILPLVDLAVVTDSIRHFAHTSRPDKYLNLLPATDTRIFYDPQRPRDINISFNGGVGSYPDRISGIQALRENGIEVVKTGGQLEDHLSIEEYARVFMRSKITLNFSRSGEKLTLKGRLLEATLCGAMLLESENPETTRWFEPMVEYVSFRDEKDLVDKARYYLEHDSERMEVAMKGKKKAQELCQGKNFWGKILSQVQSKRLFDDRESLRLLTCAFLDSGEPDKAHVHLKTLLDRYPDFANQEEGKKIIRRSRTPVSILTICRNSERTIRRCIESVLKQDYENFEYIIQDGKSTDRTLNIIKEFTDCRIKLVSEPDSGGSEAYFKGLCRCTGDIIGLCWSDEEYLPGAVSWGVENLSKNPDVAAIYGDVYATDIRGNILEGCQRAPEWDLAKYLCWEIMPNYCGSFMRASHLKSSGFFEYTASFFKGGNVQPDQTNCIMYDYFAKVGVKHRIQYIPQWVGKFSVRGGQLSSTPSVLFDMIPTLFRSIDHLCDQPDTPQSIRALRLRAYAGFHLAMINSLIVNAGAFNDAEEMLRKALTYEPNLERLTKVVEESIAYFIANDHVGRAFNFINIIRDANFRIPGLKYLEASIFFEMHRYEEAFAKLSSNHIEEEDDQKLRKLLEEYRFHENAKAQIEKEIRTIDMNEDSKQLKSELLSFTDLKNRKLQRRLGNIFTGEPISVAVLLDVANTLFKVITRPKTLTIWKERNPANYRLIERILLAYLFLAGEENAVELEKRLAQILFGGLKAGQSVDLPTDQGQEPIRFEALQGDPYGSFQGQT